MRESVSTGQTQDLNASISEIYVPFWNSSAVLEEEKIVQTDIAGGTVVAAVVDHCNGAFAVLVYTPSRNIV